MVQVALVVLSRTDLLIDLISNFGVSLGLLFDQLKDIQLLEALSRLKLFNYLTTLLVGVFVAAWPDKNDSWFNTSTELRECLVKVLL